MQIISGSSAKELASKIAEEIGAELLRAKINHFEDGELKVQVLDKIGKNVAIIQSTHNPVNTNLVELLLLIDTAKRAGAKNITAIIPYFGYSRQNKCHYEYGPIPTSLIIKMIEAAGATEIITLDLHSEQIDKTFNIPIENLSTEEIFLPKLESNKNIAIVSPDAGGIERAKNYSSLLGCELSIIDKTRDKSNNPVMMGLDRDVKGKNCIIVDDIVDSANTLCMATELLLKHGAKNVKAIITHAVLSQNAIEKIMDSSLDYLYISNSIKCDNLPEKFEILEAHKLIGSKLIKNKSYA